LSEKAKKQRAVNAIEKRWRPEQKYLSATVTDKYNEGQEVDTRKEASDKFKVSEWKVRTVHEIEKKALELYKKLESGDLQIHEARVIWG